MGVNRRPQPLDENADLVRARASIFPTPRSGGRRRQEAFTLARPGFAVVSVAPSFTFGPDDPVGAPANKLVKAVIARKLPVTLPVGFGCLDVRDFATGVGARCRARGIRAAAIC